MATAQSKYEQAHSPNEKSPASHIRPWILVVDDEPSMRLLIEVILKSQNWDVECAEGATKALDALKARPSPPDVVICDVLMPGLDGLELVRRMCARIPDAQRHFHQRAPERRVVVADRPTRAPFPREAV